VPKLATDRVSSRDKIGWGLDSPRETKKFSCTERRLSEWDAATDQKTPTRGVKLFPGDGFLSYG